MKKREELPNFLRLNKQFDIDELQRCYEENKVWMNEEWDALSRNCAPNFTDLENLKYASVALSEFTDNGYSVMGNKRFDERNFDTLQDWVKGTYFEEVLNSFTGQPQRVRILRMDEGAVILPHIDYNTTYNVRVHIPIYTNPWSSFGVKRKTGDVEFQHMLADGGAWFINQGWEHSAWNFGKTPRIHIIFALNDQTDIEDALSTQ